MIPVGEGQQKHHPEVTLQQQHPKRKILVKEMQLVAGALAKGTNPTGQCHCCVQLQAMESPPSHPKADAVGADMAPGLCHGLWAEQSPGLSLCPRFQTRPPSGFSAVTWSRTWCFPHPPCLPSPQFPALPSLHAGILTQPHPKAAEDPHDAIKRLIKK